MERKLFGTDGIRGMANKHPMTCEIAMALGRAVTHHFQLQSKKHKRPLIIVGKDTRRSCYMLEQAFSAGVCSQGGKVILTGPLPTPGVAFVTGSMRADAGVVISASHNAYSDNGIKIFDGRGYKLPDEVELQLEDMILNPDIVPMQTGPDLGKAMRLDEVVGRYVVHVKSTFNPNYSMDDMRVVIDCANGAGYKVGPMIFSELGAEVFPIHVDPDGININNKCGSLHPSLCQDEILRFRADIGFCLDGDADRLVVIDALGKVVDGDQLIGLFAKKMLAEGELKVGDTVVGTVMSNLGLEHFIKSLGLKFARVKVGDRYIMEYMRTNGAILGGEPSGHIILKTHSTTGDGILSALKTVECMKFYKTPLHELTKNVKLFPQILRNVVVKSKPPLDTFAPIQNMVKEIEQTLGDMGRMILRYSGTENLLRIMIESESEELNKSLCTKMQECVQKELD
ncbi:MAG: phosphoglucosamine mutase [Bacteriovoracaceae bacterium]|nr:phosphoglucosamine mutase [Bacteriovoracaceae bacterium]